MRDTRLAKAWGCLAGLAIGDAMGMPVEGLTAEEIRRQYGRVTVFQAPLSTHPHAALLRGTVTDDTEHTLLIADVYIRDGRMSTEAVARALVEWTRRRDGLSLSVLGPSTRRALRLLLEGVDPLRAGAGGRTAGAAMRVAPVGIVHAGSPEQAIGDAVAASLPTHGTSVAISGAGAVAAAVAAAMDPTAQIDAVVQAAIRGAEAGATFGVQVAGASVARRIELACRLAGEAPAADAPRVLADSIGVDMFPTEAVPTAIALLVLHDGAPFPAILDAVNLGGDTDTLAAIAGAIGGALRGIGAFPRQMVDEVERVNRLSLREVAGALTALTAPLRRRAAGD